MRKPSGHNQYTSGNKRLSPKRMTQNKKYSKRRKHLIEQLEQGKNPVLRKYLPGAEAIYRKYNVVPKFLPVRPMPEGHGYDPDVNEDKRIERKLRKRAANKRWRERNNLI